MEDDQADTGLRQSAMGEELLVLLTFVGAITMTAWMRRYALSHQLVDIPGARSSHQLPTPRGCGAAIVVCYLLAVGWLFLDGRVAANPVLALIGGGALIAAVGFWDDHGHVPPLVRLLAHVAAAVWALAWLGTSIDVPLPTVLELPAFVLAMLIGVALVWMTNLYNFMDGIDGIAASEAVFVGFGAAALLWLTGPAAPALGVALLGVASAGFLVWNWPPAKVFMGDVGSGFLGYAFGTLALWTASVQWLSIWSWLILLAVFVVDSTWTLLRRVGAGERFYEAHRSHAYQIMTRRWGGHGKVTGVIAAINVVWLWPLAWCAESYRAYGAIVALLAVLPLAFICWVLDAGSGNA